MKYRSREDCFISLSKHNFGLDESGTVSSCSLFPIFYHRRLIIKTTTFQFKLLSTMFQLACQTHDIILSFLEGVYFVKFATPQSDLQQFQLMEEQIAENPKAREYLTSLLDQHGQKDSALNIQSILKQKEHNVTQKLNQGQLEINLNADNERGHLANHILKRKEINPFETNYKGFFFNSDRDKSQERLQIFKKIKEQYSKEKTSIVVKQVQKKIKEWTSKKLQIEKKKQRSRERKNRIQMEMIQQLKKLQVERREAEKQGRKEEVLNRLKLMQEKRQQRQNLMKQSSIRSLDVKSPKYKQIQEKFKQIEEKIKQQRERVLEQKRLSMKVDTSDIQEHSKKYEQIIKQREEERKNKLNLKIKQAQLENRESFNAFSNKLRQKKKQQLQKRKRMKQFQEKIKSVMIVRKKAENEENEQQSVVNKSKVIQKPDVQKEVQDVDGKKVRKRKLAQSVDGKKLGNEYLKFLKQKDHQLLKNSENRQKLSNSTSLPVIKPIYKNYLTQVKVKRKPVGDQIEQLKRSCQNEKEIYKKLHQKSQVYESSMMKKINQLKKINKYDQSVARESQIDELYSRYIKVRLAAVINT